MYARDRAVRRAGFFVQVFAAEVVACVSRQRDPRISALLRAVVNQSVFANVEVASTGATTPVVGQAFCDVFLERMNACEAALLQSLHLVIDAAFFASERLQLAAAIVNNSDSRSETKLHGALSDHERILRMRNAATHHGIYIHVKVRMLGEQLQFLVENLQTLLRYFVGIHVVDGDLQPLQPATIQ